MRRWCEVIASVVSAGAFAAGCTTNISGTPVADTASPLTSKATTSASAAPPGKPVGTAVMKVLGGDAQVTIRYRINGGPEQTETNVTLPWEKQYTVYDEVESEVTADGSDIDLTCSIILDGKLASFKTEPRPTCSFAYYG
ncbi:hypothetical protein [Mycobacterium celatum]|uniref:hypothetical protein n=1 Tax=Mycobacterium celatum TaxID=28045 RepID=UPI00146CCC75|nr:hypothetical protein [Mycobacterium celatum]